MKLYGYASVFNIIDSQNDMIIKGAFKQNLADYRAKGKNIPVCFSHDTTNIIGIVKSAIENKTGLYICVELFKDGLKTKDIQLWLNNCIQLGYSIGYTVKQVTYVSGIRQLITASLSEISICLNPANPLCLVTTIREKC